MKADTKKYQFMILGKTKRSFTQEDTKESEVRSLILPGNSHLTFEEHINHLCRTGNNKVHVLRFYHISRKYLPLDKAKNLCFALLTEELFECV